MRFLFSLLIVFFSFNSCTSQKKDSAENNYDTSTSVKKNASPQTGKIVSNIVCESDKRFSYSIYLPASYQDKKIYPAVIFFDPHAKADIPLEKYRNLADKFGYILLASCDSKNGLSPGIYPEIYAALKNELTEKYRVRKNRIYCAGFSGGARVAINIGLSDKSIAGVIANSAGFEPSRSPITNDFVFAGVAGNEDFNLLEQKRTEKSLSEFSIPHLFTEFDGKHEWASELSMERIFIFFESISTRKEKSSENDSIVFSFLNREQNEAKGINTPVARYQFLKNILPLIFEQSEIVKYNNELSLLSKSAEVQSYLKAEEAEMLNELRMQNEYYQRIFSESLEWWQTQIKIWNEEKQNLSRNKLYQRIKSYLSLAIYMTISSPQARQDALIMEKLTELYSLVDPENNEWAYQKAILRASQGNINEAELLIRRGVELGFADKERFLKQVEFVPLHSNVQILSLFK